jgi:hypothetical protein
MTRGFQYSRRRVFVSAALVVIAVVSLLWRSGAVAAKAARLRAEQGDELSAAGRLASLAPFDESHLDALRERVRRFRSGLGGNATLDGALHSLGTRWVRESDTNSEHGSYLTKTGRFAMTSPTAADWPAIVGTVEAMEKIPGMCVQQLDLGSTEGSGGRSLGEASLVLVAEMTRDAGPGASR